MSEGAGLYVADGLFLGDAVLLAFMVVGVVAALVPMTLLSRSPDGRRHVSDVLLGLLVGFFILTFVLLVPVIWVTQGGDPLLAFLRTTFLTIQSPTLNSGAADVVGGLPTSWVGSAYCVLLNVCYVAMPLLAISNIPDLLGHRLSRLRYWAICRWGVRGRSVYVFSGLGDREMSLAGEVLSRAGKRGAAGRAGRPVVIFANVSHVEKDEFSDALIAIDSADLHCLEQGFSDVALRLCNPIRFKTCSLFALSDDATRNVAKTCTALAKLRGTTSTEGGIELPGTKAFLQSANVCEGTAADGDLPVNRVKFYVRIDSPDDQLVIDAANTSTGGAEGVCPLRVRTLKEESLAAFSLLRRAPLYRALSDEPASCVSLRPSVAQELNVLVLGSGSFAEAMVLNVLWAAQMHNVLLHVTVAGEGVAEMEARMRMRYRGLFEIDEHFGAGYTQRNLFDLSFVPCSLRSPELYRSALGPLAACEHLYLIVALEDGDAANHEIALNARLFYLDYHVGEAEPPIVPTIAALIKDESMARLVSGKLDLGTKSYGIVTFGSDLFGYDSVLSSDLEREAQSADDVYGYVCGVGGVFHDERANPDDVRTLVVDMLENPPRGGVRSQDISSAPQVMYHSNLAQALHAEYKAWAMGLDSGEGVRANAGLEISAEVVERMAQIEHNRWWVMYLTFGYTYLTPDQRQRFSSVLGVDFANKNRLRKLDEVRKHALLCPWERVWDNYASAVGGFAYRLPATLGEGSTRLVLRVRGGAPDLEAIRLQLVTQRDHLVVDSWDAGSSPHAVPSLPAGSYLVHPVSAPSGFQVADDVEVVVDGRDEELTVDLSLPDCSPLVNPAVYDMAFCCSIWWHRANGLWR
ncbi:hypothetical protein [Olsenella sp. An188]|uniref:hypothetical protein n=1 Tax=Olsenella sp. An188 TaxID=1965579 RepID=UPI000B3976A1|nr:hypothetical protein [Olsenella sp. An188]OUP38488.1 hypothetical protein B5F23_05835 [Olsenella sp. An188]